MRHAHCLQVQWQAQQSSAQSPALPQQPNELFTIANQYNYEQHSLESSSYFAHVACSHGIYYKAVFNGVNTVAYTQSDPQDHKATKKMPSGNTSVVQQGYGDEYLKVVKSNL